MEVKCNNIKEIQSDLEEMFHVSASDSESALVETRKSINARKIGQLARKAKAPVEVVLCPPGEVKIMSDGTRYEVQEDGSWKRT